MEPLPSMIYDLPPSWLLRLIYFIVISHFAHTHTKSQLGLSRIGEGSRVSFISASLIGLFGGQMVPLIDLCIIKEWLLFARALNSIGSAVMEKYIFIF